jgi:VIT1/CCC1 family predicted Fe2+/Mn2+ transporter
MRAVVPGAIDGLGSTVSLSVGEALAQSDRSEILTAGRVGLMAGASAAFFQNWLPGLNVFIVNSPYAVLDRVYCLA